MLDTAPNADQSASLAARGADLVLIPCRAATFDLEAIETTLLLAKAAAKPAYVVLNAVPPRSGIGKEAAAELTDRGARVAPRQITQRAAFTHSVIMAALRRNSSRQARPPRKYANSMSGYVVL